MLHFAYGANLCKALMGYRCPAAAALCAAELPDYRLVFCTYATIEPHAGSTVPGALWALSPECEAVLDQFEGLASGHYHRETVQVRRAGASGMVWAMAYRRVDTVPAPPPPAYLDVIRQGYDDFGLDAPTLEVAAIR